jgi:hypothetical protein
MKPITFERCKRIIAHIIAESLGYASPDCALHILDDAVNNRQNFCEWVWECFNSNPLPVVVQAIRNRHFHFGFMRSYKQARVVINERIQNVDTTMAGLASWM